MKKRKGFTLIEVIIVLGVIAILLGAAVPRLAAYRRHQDEMDRENQEAVLNKAIIQYYALTGRYPAIYDGLNPIGESAFIGEITARTGITVDTGTFDIIIPYDSGDEYYPYDSYHKVVLDDPRY